MSDGSLHEENAVDLRLLVTEDEHVPMYLQLVHQIRYLVTSRELSAGAQLPSVRTLAARLGINTGTVAQAYRMLKAEGLIDSRQGLGSYVVPQPDQAGSFSARQVRFAGLIDETVARAYAMGFDRNDVRQQVMNSLQQQARTLPVVLVAPNESAANKYARLVHAALPAELLPTVIPSTIDEVKRGEPRVLDAYRRAYFTVVAFMSNIPVADEALRQYGITSELIGLTAVLSAETKGRLRELETGSRHALVTEARNVNTALGLLDQHSALDLSSLRILTELSSDEQIRELRDELVIHTFGVSDLLDRCGIPAERRLELAFTLSDESYTRLRHIATRVAQPA